MPLDRTVSTQIEKNTGQANVALWFCGYILFSLPWKSKFRQDKVLSWRSPFCQNYNCCWHKYKLHITRFGNKNTNTWFQLGPKFQLFTAFFRGVWIHNTRRKSICFHITRFCNCCNVGFLFRLPLWDSELPEQHVRILDITGIPGTAICSNHVSVCHRGNIYMYILQTYYMAYIRWWSLMQWLTAQKDFLHVYTGALFLHKTKNCCL